MSRLEPATLNGAKKRTKSANSWGFWRSLVVTLAVALGVRHFLIEARYIPSGSMLPGLQLQDRLLVEKLTYRARPPKRGEIVVFRAPQSFDPALKQDYAVSPVRCFIATLPIIGGIPGVQQPACEAFIKRVVAIPGDKVEVDPSGHLKINGKAVKEPYVTRYCPTGNGQGCRPLRAVVPPSRFWCSATTAPTAGMDASGLAPISCLITKSLAALSSVFGR